MHKGSATGGGGLWHEKTERLRGRLCFLFTVAALMKAPSQPSRHTNTHRGKKKQNKKKNAHYGHVAGVMDLVIA